MHSFPQKSSKVGSWCFRTEAEETEKALEYVLGHSLHWLLCSMDGALCDVWIKAGHKEHASVHGCKNYLFDQSVLQCQPGCIGV